MKFQIEIKEGTAVYYVVFEGNDPIRVSTQHASLGTRTIWTNKRPHTPKSLRVVRAAVEIVKGW